MRAMLGTMRAELVGAGGVVERNAYLTKRYIWWDLAWFVWTVANTLTIVFIAKGIEAEGGTLDVEETMTTLLIGAVVWAYLGILFEFLMETVAWERWEGTIEYTFMAPLSRAMHLAGQGVFAILYGLLRATFLFVICGFVFFDLSMPDATVLRRVRRAARRVGLVHRHRDDDVRPPAHLTGEGDAARVRRPGHVAGGVRACTTRSRSCRSGCSGSRRSRRRRTRSKAREPRSSRVPRCRPSGATSGR